MYEIFSNDGMNLNNMSPSYNLNTMKSNLSDDYFDYYVVKKGDNLYDIARKNNIDVNDLLLINGLKKDDYIYPDQKILVPKSNYKIIITKDNDTFSSISKRLNIPVSDLINQNSNLYLIPEQLIVYRK